MSEKLHGPGGAGPPRGFMFCLSKAVLNSRLIAFAIFENKHSIVGNSLADAISTGS